MLLNNGWGTNPAMPRPSEGPSASWGPYFLCRDIYENGGRFSDKMPSEGGGKPRPRGDG